MIIQNNPLYFHKTGITLQFVITITLLNIKHAKTKQQKTNMFPNHIITTTMILHLRLTCAFMKQWKLDVYQ